MKPKSTRPSEMERLLLRLGFVYVRAGKGSHRFYRNPDGRTTLISFHPGPIPTGTLRKIIADIGLTVDKFNGMILRP